MRLPWLTTRLISPHRDLATALALLAMANSLAAGFTIFHLLRDTFTPLTAVLFVGIEMCAALLWAVLLGSTALGRQPTERIVAAGMASLGLFYVGLLFAPTSPKVGTAVAGFGFGGYVMLFYVPFIAAVLTLTKTANRSTVMGSYTLVFTMVAMAVPLLGGALIDSTSFAHAGTIALTIVAASIVFVLFFAHLPAIPSIQLHRDLPKIMPRSTSIALFGEGIAEGAIWAGQAVLAFQYLTTASGYGRLIALLGLIGAAATVLLGRRSDRSASRRGYLLLGIAFLAVGAVLGLRQGDLWSLVVALGAISFGLPVTGTFLFAAAADGGGSPAGLALWREILLNVGRLLAVGLLLMALSLGALQSGIFLLVLGAVFVLVVMAMSSTAVVGSKAAPPES